MTVIVESKPAFVGAIVHAAERFRRSWGLIVGAVFLLLGLRRPNREYGLTVGEGGCYKTNSTLIEAMAPRSKLLIEGNGQRRPSFCKEWRAPFDCLSWSECLVVMLRIIYHNTEEYRS